MAKGKIKKDGKRNEKPDVNTENVEKKEDFQFNKQFFVIVCVMVALVVIVLLFYWYFQSMTYVNFHGLKFVKEKYGSLLVYRYDYIFDHAGQNITYHLYLRTDPKKLDVIPVEGEIEYFAGKFFYVSTNNTGFEKCENAALGAGTLGAFLANNYINFKAASPDQNEAKAKNISYRTCDMNTTNTLLLIQTSNETKITKRDNCYEMDVANCQILEAVEKWEVQSIIDAKKSSNVDNKSDGIYSLR